jgi:hypothetical protein
MTIFALAVVVGFCLLAVGSVLYMSSRDQARLDKVIQRELELHREQRINWERERERLMNRVMVKEWQTYTQMTQAMAPSEESSSLGMSDDEEVRRYLDSLGAAQGIGEEVLVDMEPDMKDLGL